MSKRAWSQFAWSGVGLVVALVGASLADAQVGPDRQGLADREAAERARVTEARRLADSILEQRQATIGRDFGPGYRETVLPSLAGVPLEVLRQIERDGGEGDLRAAIEAARTA